MAVIGLIALLFYQFNLLSIRDYILHTILSNYSKDATVLISTHLIEDIEPVLDEAIFLKEGTVFAHRSVDEIRENEGMSVDAYFREVFKC